MIKRRVTAASSRNRAVKPIRGSKSRAESRTTATVAARASVERRRSASRDQVGLGPTAVPAHLTSFKDPSREAGKEVHRVLTPSGAARRAGSMPASHRGSASCSRRPTSRASSTGSPTRSSRSTAAASRCRAARHPDPRRPAGAPAGRPHPGLRRRPRPPSAPLDITLYRDDLRLRPTRALARPMLPAARHRRAHGRPGRRRALLRPDRPGRAGRAERPRPAARGAARRAGRPRPPRAADPRRLRRQEPARPPATSRCGCSLRRGPTAWTTMRIADARPGASAEVIR